MVSENLFSTDGGERVHHSNVLVVFTDGKPYPPKRVKPFSQTLPPLRASQLLFNNYIMSSSFLYKQQSVSVEGLWAICSTDYYSLNLLIHDKAVLFRNLHKPPLPLTVCRVFLQIDKQVHMESAGYGPPDKINKKNLMELAAPNKALILNKIKDYKKRGPQKLFIKQYAVRTSVWCCFSCCLCRSTYAYCNSLHKKSI